MNEFEEQLLNSKSTHSGNRQPLVLRVTDADFQQEVLGKLARLEAMMEMRKIDIAAIEAAFHG